MSFYRIQDNTIPTEQLLDPAFQISESYSTGTVRAGKSVCRSIEDLAAYFAQTGVPVDTNTAVVVELKGTYSDEDDEDENLGAYLIYPTEIVSVTPIADSGFFAAVDAYFGE